MFFLECAFVELSLAVRTNKVLWVVLAIHCSDTSSGDRLVASSAQRTALSMEMCLAIRHPIVLKECSSAKRNTALLMDNTQSRNTIMIKVIQLVCVHKAEHYYTTVSFVTKATTEERPDQKRPRTLYSVRAKFVLSNLFRPL
jgi:hypothetical protein